MTLKLKDKVAVITGASKGIGAGIAKAYALAGAEVVVNYAKDKSRAEKVVNHIIALGGKAIAVQADVSKPADVERLFKEAVTAFDKVDILVNNAGIYDVVMLEALTIEILQTNINTNLIGTILCAQKALEVMGKEGVILLISVLL